MKDGLFIRLSLELKALVEEVAKTYGISQADFVRYSLRHELERLGLLKARFSLEKNPLLKPKER